MQAPMHSHPFESDGDWRLQIELREKLHVDRLSALLARGQGRLERMVRDGRIGADVVVSLHDMTIFAYASTATGLHEADAAIRKALIADGRTATIRAARWDEATEAWEEFDPALPPGHERGGGGPLQIVRRTTERTVGTLARSQYVRDVRSYADSRGLTCEIVAHSGVLRTDLDLTVTGPTHAVRDFMAYARR